MLRALFFCFCIFLLSFSVPSLAEQEKSRLILAELIEEALQNNPEIQAATKGWDAATERIPQAYALEDPMLGFGIVNLPLSFKFTEEDMTMKELSVSQKFPFPGKRMLMKGMAEKEAEVALREKEDKANWVVKEVKSAFFDLAHTYRIGEVTERNKRILEDLVKVAETRYALGMGIQQELLKGHLEISKMVDELIMVEQKREALEARLKSLLNRPPNESLGRPQEPLLKKLALTVDELQEMALQTNPTLLATRSLIESKEKARSLAMKERYPDFTLRFAYGQRDDSPEMTRRDVVSAMAEINIPIFKGSKQDRKVAESESSRQATEAQYHTTKNDLFYMIANMASMVRRLEKRLDLYKTGIIRQASLQVNSAMSAYAVNKADFADLLESRMTLYRYELEYHEALTEHEKSLATLEMLLGQRLPIQEL